MTEAKKINAVWRFRTLVSKAAQAMFSNWLISGYSSYIGFQGLQNIALNTWWNFGKAAFVSWLLIGGQLWFIFMPKYSINQVLNLGDFTALCCKFTSQNPDTKQHSLSCFLSAQCLIRRLAERHSPLLSRCSSKKPVPLLSYCSPLPWRNSLTPHKRGLLC